MGKIVQTNTGPRNTTYPRLVGENADVFPGSPLAVIGLWVFALRSRFEASAASPLPWIWDENLRPEDNEDANPLPEGSPRKVVVESSYNVEKANRNYRPAIYVGRGDITPEKVSVDNKVGVYLPTQLKAYHCYARMPIVMECISEGAGESSSIGDVVWSFILTTRDIFRKDFGFHELTEPVLGNTVPEQYDKEVWNTKVIFQVSFDVRWGTIPIAPKLRDMLVKMNAQRGGVQKFFLDLAARDLIEP